MTLDSRELKNDSGNRARVVGGTTLRQIRVLTRPLVKLVLWIKSKIPITASGP